MDPEIVPLLPREERALKRATERPPTVLSRKYLYVKERTERRMRINRKKEESPFLVRQIEDYIHQKSSRVWDEELQEMKISCDPPRWLHPDFEEVFKDLLERYKRDME
jgi:hypothetical protein